MNNFDVLLGMKLGGGGGSSTLVEKTITANGTYNPADDNADGYSSVTANVPNTYTLSDEGKVVDSGVLVSQTSRQITSNNTYNTTLNNEVVVNVPNSYDLADEGKVVSSGALVSQSSRNIDANGLYDTTLNNSVNVDVPNSYTVVDEGKVVSSGALVSQTAYPSTVTQNGTYDTTLNNSVTVDVSTGGSGDDVIFIDYDGTELYKYSKNDFLALTEMPANPTHTGLTAQGWNWSLSDAKTYVTNNTKLYIGQMYVTDDGKTHLDVDVSSSNLTFDINVSSGTGNIEWGDGSSDIVTTTGIYSHTYTSGGTYTIKLTNSVNIFTGSSSGSNMFGVISSSVSANKLNCLKRVRIGSGISSIGAAGFTRCTALETITLPQNITSFGNNLMGNCCSLYAIVIPNRITKLSRNLLYACVSLVMVSVPNNITSMGDGVFKECYSIKELTLPDTIASLVDNKSQICQSDYSLTYFHIPRGLNELSNQWFAGCYALKDITLHNGLTTMSTYVFDNCYSITNLDFPCNVAEGDCRNVRSLKSVSINGNVGTMAFYGCTSLNSVALNNTVTIGTQAFYACYSLTNIDIPSTVTTINSTAFQNCDYLGTITINKVQDSISGAPWGATNATVVWTG